MAIDKKVTDRLASKFCQAFYTGIFGESTDILVSDLTIDDAYGIQDKVIQLRLSKGEKIVGYKVGCTSHAIRNQFGLNEPIIGKLMSPHLYFGTKTLFLDNYFNCAIEPEFVFSINRDLTGKNLERDFLINAIEYVSAGIEVHNLKFWFSPLTSQELIASNGIHSSLIIGNDKVSPGQLDFISENFSVFKNNALVAEGTSREIMGDPINSLRFLISHLTERGRVLKAGRLVIPGSPVELIEIDEDATLKIEISRVGAVHAKFVSESPLK
jgi:2-keto-4-pentenoate hydratase